MIPENTGVHVLSKVNIADQPFYEYTYNSANLITEEKSKYNFTVHYYNDLNQLVATDYYTDPALLSKDLDVLNNALNRKGLIGLTNSGAGVTEKYEYNTNGQLKKTIITRPDSNIPEYSEYSYDENDRISRQVIFADNKILGYIDYLYDTRGNLVKETLYSISSAGLPELSTTTQYEFDNHQNPFKSFYTLMIPGIYTNPNNIIKETYIIHFKPEEGTDIVRTTLTSYTYNSEGYPTRKNDASEYLYK